jgi:hypothetical protein
MEGTMAHQMTAAQVGAALDLNCMIRRLLANRGPLSTAEKAEISALGVRMLAAINGHEPAPQQIDEATARAAFEATLKAMTIAGISNAQLAAWFNGSAIERVQGGGAA